MEQQPAIRTGVTASAIAHLSILALVLFLSDVHPFHSVTAETIAVDIVTPQEVVPEKPEPPVQLPPDLSVLTKEPTTAPSATPQAAAAPSQPMPQQQASSLATAKNQRVAAIAPKAEVGSAAPGYAQPQPDLTIKYNVMLGLPPELPMPTAAGSGEKSDDGYDASGASMTADVSSSVVA